jgi:signal transduction histidine kinase
MLDRLPIRWRLTLAFAGVIALVLAVVGVVVYRQLASSLDEQVADRVDVRTAQLASQARAEPGYRGALAGDEDDFGQILSGPVTVAAATPALPDRALLTRAEYQRALGGDLVVARRLDSGEGATNVRLHARPVGGGRVVVAGGTYESRDEALGGLLAAFLVGGPLALLLASAAGYGLAGAALRPVESMRRRAGEISADTSATRLPLPPADDEVRRLGETLNAMLDRLDEGLRRERRFVADASHELRTPLTALQTELEVALRRPREREELRAALVSAGEEVARLAQLAEDLLVLAASQDGKLPLRLERLPVDELLGSVARRFTGRAAALGRSVAAGPAPGVELEGDRLRLEQALGNLVDNALRHGSGGIRLRAALDDGRIALEVLDEGGGVPAEFAARAWEPFSRADEARGRGGTGLGLAIVAAIARAHGGAAELGRSADGRSRAAVSIPAV